MNFLTGRLVAGEKPGFNFNGLDVDLSRYAFNDTTPSGESEAWLGIRPEHIHVGPEAVKKAFSHTVEVEVVEPMGSDTLVWSKTCRSGIQISHGWTAERESRGRTDDRLRPGECIPVRQQDRNQTLKSKRMERNRNGIFFSAL